MSVQPQFSTPISPIKQTTGVCATCLVKVPAEVFAADGRVYIRKRCPDHGESSALISDDVQLYFKGSASGSCGTGGCMTAHSCTLMFEITQRCNLTCPTCFTRSSPHTAHTLSVDEFEQQLDRLLAAGKRSADVIQLSGGEPTVHPDFLRIVDLCFEKGVRQVFVNSNGIEFGRRPELLAHLARYEDKLQIYLQFDGFRPETYGAIRGAKGLLDLKLAALEQALALGIHVLPVMTVTRGVNLDEVGKLVKWAVDDGRIRGVMLQPAMYAGRYENSQNAERLTASAIVREVATQTDGLFEAADFGPIPCSDPNCFLMGVAVRIEDELMPISRYFPRFDTWEQPDIAERLVRFTDQLPMHMVEKLGEDELVDTLLDLLEPTGDGDTEVDFFSLKSNFFMVGIKPFMDAHTYDQDRVDACCVHVVDRAGNPVSLCEMNSLRRPRGQF